MKHGDALFARKNMPQNQMLGDISEKFTVPSKKANAMSVWNGLAMKDIRINISVCVIKKECK